MYTTRGSVRGSCGHKHSTLDAAVACARKDARAVARRNRNGHHEQAYSDRRVVRLDGQPLTDDERDAVYA